MDFYAFFSLVFPFSVVVFLISSTSLLLATILHIKKGKRKRRKRKPSFGVVRNQPTYSTSSRRATPKSLANGHTREEYQRQGFTDYDIDCWGLDQPGAPPPDAAMVILADMADGDLDGNFDIFPNTLW